MRYMKQGMIRILAAWIKYFVLFFIFGTVYYLGECLWKGGSSHIYMMVLGGVLGVIIGRLNQWFGQDTSFLLQCIVGALLITLCEAVLGYQWNVVQRLGIWDYSGLPFSGISGQVDILFSIFIWIPVSAAAIVVDDWLRYWLFGEERPRYRL